MFDALHPRTILAYGMNRLDLPITSGAPARVRVASQLGYKSVKYLHRIVVTDEFNDWENWAAERMAMPSNIRWRPARRS
jgi:DMSO/TMAO reductase YedYZ molybdopterin-dependent catalytic subunit